MRKRLSALAIMAVAIMLMAPALVSAATVFFQGFEEDTDGWSGVTRAESGDNGIVSATGSYHAETKNGYTYWGGSRSEFPVGGYTTSVDIYLDVDAEADNDTRFDFTSAINGPDGAFRRDFVFNAGFYNDMDLGNRFVISASNNAGRANSFPKNPGRDPFMISSTGWYTFEHHFYDDGSGVLAVDLSIMDASGTTLQTWTLSDSTDVIGDTVGGNRYGWFATNEFPFLAIDNSQLGAGPDAMDQCKNSGWESFGFKNQGQCIQFVNTGK